MKYLKRLLVFAFALTFLAPTSADAQLRGLRKRIQERAEDRIEQRANREIDKQVDKAVDAAFDASMSKVSDMFTAGFAKNKTTVDLENNVVKTEGQADISLKPNQTSPADADFVHYLQVTTYELPGNLGTLVGNGSYEQIYLHDGKWLSRNPASGSIIDTDKSTMAFMDYETQQYWELSFVEMGEMAGELVERMNEASSQAASTSEDVDVDVKAEVETKVGRTDVVRGVSAQQNHIIVRIDIDAEDSQEGESFKGTMYAVSEVWASDELAGSKTVGDFTVRMGAEMGKVVGQMGDGGPQFSMLGDPRISEAVAEASEQVAGFGAMPVQTTTWIVMVPDGQELDLQKVLDGGEPNTEAWAASLSQSPESELTEQVTMFSSTTFISNLTTEPFAVDLLEIPSNLKEMPSPLEQMQAQ